MCASCCGMCLMYKNAENLGKNGCLYVLLSCLCPCIPIMRLRKEARKRYNIEVRKKAVCIDLAAPKVYFT